jgi:hypothetical protein
MPQAATLKSLSVAFAMMKAMQAEGVEWARIIAPPPGRRLPSCWKAGLGQLIDEHFERVAELGQADRRNGW